MSEFVKMRISQDKLPSAIGLGRAVPNGRACKPRAKGELRDPGDKVRREVVAELLACSEPGRKGCETPIAHVVTALNPWWSKNQDSTLPEVLADLIDRPTTSRSAKFRTRYGREKPVCEGCGYSIGDMRWNYCPKCGRRIVNFGDRQEEASRYAESACAGQ